MILNPFSPSSFQNASRRPSGLKAAVLPGNIGRTMMFEECGFTDACGANRSAQRSTLRHVDGAAALPEESVVEQDQCSPAGMNTADRNAPTRGQKIDAECPVAPRDQSQRLITCNCNASRRTLDPGSLQLVERTGPGR